MTSNRLNVGFASIGCPVQKAIYVACGSRPCKNQMGPSPRAWGAIAESL